jgi:hypothetical protein
MTVIAVDPGNVSSAYVRIDADYRPLEFGKARNEDVLEWLAEATRIQPTPEFAIEMVASYGMAVGADVFDTCVWIGRFAETIDYRGCGAELIYRRNVKLHHCGNPRAKDGTIAQALIDRFAAGQPNKGKGTKADPGWFHGFHTDIWQAYALAVYVADSREAGEALRDYLEGGA